MVPLSRLPMSFERWRLAILAKVLIIVIGFTSGKAAAQAQTVPTVNCEGQSVCVLPRISAVSGRGAAILIHAPAPSGDVFGRHSFPEEADG